MRFAAIQIKQGGKKFFTFRCNASTLWGFSEINRRQEDKDIGYQRVLSTSRVNRIRDFILQGNVIPGAIIISFDNATFHNGYIEVPDVSDAAWIIDGQHRSAGAEKAAKEGCDISFAVIAFLDLSEQEQADYFVTINREAKGVPSSLYLDLLRNLPKKKTDKERLEERIADISKELTRNSESIFFNRVVSTTSPKTGQVSLTNFARKLRSVLHPTNGILGTYTLPEQVKVIENYYFAVSLVFPKQFGRNLFFKTLGFGAMWRAFPIIFSASLNRHGGFRTSDVEGIFGEISGFDFDSWLNMGTGSSAEIQAGDDLIAEIQAALQSENQMGVTLKL